MMTGAIIDIKRFTLHDGPGIRSTLFLKGCGLRCAWCQNPEGLEPSPRLFYISKECIRCGRCEASCPQEAIRLSERSEPFVRIDRDRCTNCGECVAACPTNALAFDGSTVSAEEAAGTLLRDQEFYRQSGGGITISGGDPLVQHEFALRVLGLCRNAGVHTAIETCLFGDWEIVRRFIPLTDLFIVDLKIAHSALHVQYTGRANELVLDNYARLARAGVELLTRVPLIPGITATEANLRAMARVIRDNHPGGRVELVNFNPLAVAKYALMDRSTRPFEGMGPLAAAEVARLAALLEAEGLAVVRDHERPAGSGA